MQRLNKIKTYVKKLVGSFYKRHKFFCISLGVILLLYLIIFVFFTQPIVGQTHFSKAYYDRNEKLLRLTISEDEKYRLFTPVAEISPHLKKATILYEDRYFRYHPGINPVSLTNAAFNYFIGKKNRLVGASTITMQVARTRYDLNTKTPSGKLRQIFHAFYLELFYSKSSILEAYLNLAPYGGNIEGVGSASLIYFNKRAQNLSLIESITLSTIPQNPTKRSLLNNTGQDNMMNMRKDLVKRWVEIYPKDANLLILADMPLAVTRTFNLPFYAPHFTDYEISKNNNYWHDIGNTDSEIITTLDLNLQKRLENIMTSEVIKRKSIGINNAAALLINYKTMEVLAYIGSADYFNKEIFGENNGVLAKRSPGSILKPLIYAAAVDKGLINGMTLLKDAKINFGVYAPENSDSEFFGPILARDALIYSRNIPAIELTRKIGGRHFYNLLKDSGVTGLKDLHHYGISIALGGAELSMMETANIYATMANLGKEYKIQSRLGFKQTPARQVLSQEAFFLVLDMLGRQGNMQTRIPFSKKQENTLQHFWKTGTSSSFRDAWTAGIFSDYVLITWVGNFDGTPNNSFSGAHAAAPMYFALGKGVQDYYQEQGINIPGANFYTPDLNVSEVEMCDKVGGLAGIHCPKSVLSYFIPGKSPIETTSVYKSIPIDKKTGRRACFPDAETTYMKVFEFWEPEYLDMFKRAGIKRETPPVFVEGCNLDSIKHINPSPIIMTPINKSRIVITSKKDEELMSFKAIISDDYARIFWFLNDDMIGTTTSGATLERSIKMGDYKLRAISELGGSTQINFTVVK